MRAVLDPMDSRSVARWAAQSVYDDITPKYLWVRVTLDGPGYVLTPLDPPKAGRWTRVCLIDMEDATVIAERGARGWGTLRSLAERIETALREVKAT